MKYGTVKNALDTLGQETIQKMYQEEKTLTNLANKLNMNIETIRQYFIKNDIEYDKQVRK